MNREFDALQQVLTPYGLDAAALLRAIAANQELVSRPTRLEMTLPGGVECCVSRCGLDEVGGRYFLAPFELAEEEALDLHYLTVGGRVHTFRDLWQGPWQAPRPAAIPAAAA